MWADKTYTIGWGTASGTASTNFAAVSGSVDGILSFSTAKNSSATAPAYNSTSSELRLYYNSGGNGGSITFTPAEGVVITGFVMKTSTSPTVGYSVDGGNVNNISASNNTYTLSGISASSSLTIKNVNTSNTQLRIKTIDISYTTSGGDTPILDDCDLALTGDPIALNFDLYNNASAQVINYTTTSTGAVTIDDNDYAEFDIDEENKTITVTPTAVTPSAQTITVNQDADDNYEAGSTTFTLNITDSTPIPTYTATFSVNGVTTSQNYEEGAAIVFPDDPADINGKTFVGWTTTAINGTTNDVPTFVTSATMGQTDLTYYAVFALLTKGSQVMVTDELDCEWTGVSGTSYTDWSGKIATSSAVYAGNTAGGYSSIQLRTSGSPSGIVSTTSGGRVAKVIVEWNSNTANGRQIDIYGSNTVYENVSDLHNSKKQGTKLGTILKGETELTVAGDYAYVGIRSYNSALYMSKLSIVWETGTPDTYSDYCTTVVAPAVEKPVISVTSPFTFSTEVTISCGTDDASIYYTLDESDPTVESTEYTAPFNINATTTIKAIAIKDANVSSIASVTATKNLVTPTVSISGNLVLDLNGETNVNAGTLNANVTYNEATVVGAEVTWSSNNEDIATINEYTGAVTIKNRGTVTFTATYAANSDYEEATATITVTVTDSKAPGSLANPYKVSDITAVEDGVYVQGIISSITEVSTQYKNATYKISEDGTTTNEFTVFRGKYLDNADFTNTNQISVGDAVVIYGNITTYNEQLQLGQGNYLVSMVRKVATPTFDPESGEVMAGSTVTISTTTEDATIYYTTNGDEPTTESAEYTEPITINADMTIKAIAVKDGMTNSNVASASYTINVTPTITISTNSIEAPAAGIDDMMAIEYANLTISDETDFEVQYYDGEGEETDDPDWMAVEVITEDGENYSLLYSIGENTSTLPRTAYFKVYAMDDETNLVYSDLVTVTQAGVVIDYATLPFDFNGGKSNLPTGMTQSGLGSDYSSNNSPNTQLKFDSSDDYVILKINEAATELSFDIKGNSFSNGTFTVQASTDGVEYTDLEVYTDISESQEKLLLNENVRYIKWVYTDKKSGNVGLGNIKVQKRLGNATVTLASACNDGEGLYYGTYSNAAGFIVPEDLIVAEVGIDGENKLIVTEYTAGDIVPANTGVMVSSGTAGAHNIVLSTGATYLSAGENRLRATGNEGITATAMDEADPDCVFYRLTMHNKTDLGFYWGAADGVAFDVVANKAYLAVPKSAGARIQGFSFEDGVITGIRNITPALSEGEGAIFDLQGRRVAKPVNGLYIVNGKKIVIK